MFSLESDQMTALWPNDSLTFTFYVTFIDNILNGASFVKEVYWFRVEPELNKVEENMIEKENILKIDPNDFEYDAENDTINAKDLATFEKMIEEHPSVHTLRRDTKRDKKIANLKQKIFDTLT